MPGAVVSFVGDRGGECPLSWGQRAIWGAVQRLVPNDAALNMGWITAIEAEGVSVNTPLERLTDTVRAIVLRHESLRTMIRLDAQSHPYQVLCQTGEIAIEVVDDGDPAALRDRLITPVFSYGTEFPLRVGAIRTNGFVTHAIFVVSHLATDRGGLNRLVRDVLDGLAGKPLSEMDAVQPYDQALYQTSDLGRRQSEKALRYWERKLSAVPLQRFGAQGPASEPRYWNGILNSPAMDKAVTLIAARHQVSSAAVLLGAACLALADITGRPESVLQVIVGNRFRPGYADAVCPTAQDGLCVVEVGDSDFSEVVERAMGASMSAYLHAQYDPSALDRVLERLGTDLSCSFNDRRFDDQTPPSAVATEEEVRSLVPATTFRWDPPLDKYGARYFLHINGVAEAIELCLFADTTVMPPPAIEEYLRRMESVTIDAALATPALGKSRR